MKTLKLLINVLLFAAAFGALALAGREAYDRYNRINTSGAQISSFDATLLGYYIDLVQGAEINRPVSNDPTAKPFLVRAGESVAQIGNNLQSAGLVRNGELFRQYVRLNNLGQGIQAGTYQLRPNMNIREIAVVLQRAVAVEQTVTIPEGKRLEEVADILKTQLGDNFSASEFLRLARRPTFNYPFLKDLPDGASLEGYLFPDTYRLPVNPTAQDVLLRMLDNFGVKAAPLLAQGAQRGLTPRQTLTLASIIEREAVVASERPTISGVYQNRLKQGMLLQADPTTQYALEFTGKKGERWWANITVNDYGYKDPYGYNTYQYAGLPPGPIASPGESSLRAAAQPATNQFLFFVANCNKDGAHQFSVTFAEHVRKLCS